MPLSNPIQGEELVEAVAKAHAFERRSTHDCARDADHYWRNLGSQTQGEELKAARAIIPVVLEAAERAAEVEAQRCREAVAACPKWSAAQGEWSRARDACLNIIDRLRTLSSSMGREG